MINKRYTMKYYPAGRGREVYRTIEIYGNETLDELCRIIIGSFDFIDEHLYEFCMDNRMFRDYNYQSDPEGNQPSTDITLDELGLYEGQKFSLHYDFGDDWMFTITVSNISEDSRKRNPCVIKSKGSIQQYPNWDDEEWNDE